jgi:uncharacterized cupin superfamily protein
MAHMHSVNIHDAQFELEGSEPEGFATGEAYALRALGAQQVAVRLYEAAPGQAICPYHYEYKEEWLLVVTGAPALRDPNGEHPLRAGDLVRFPLGPEGAHQIINRGGEPSRIMMWSDRSWPEICVYPDSDKIGAFLPDEHSSDELLVRRADGQVPYWDGETAPD